MVCVNDPNLFPTHEFGGGQNEAKLQRAFGWGGMKRDFLLSGYL
jgi:hypothetical protein